MGNSISKSAGLRIAKLREARGLSQAALAKELAKIGLKVKRETITQWENGTRDLKTEYTVKLAEFFNVSCDEILRNKKAENIPASQFLGLSDSTITNIRYLNRHDRMAVIVLDDMLSNPEIIRFASLFGEYIRFKKTYYKAIRLLYADCDSVGFHLSNETKDGMEWLYRKKEIYKLNNERIVTEYDNLERAYNNADACAYRMTQEISAYLDEHDRRIMQAIGEEMDDGQHTGTP